MIVAVEIDLSRIVSSVPFAFSFWIKSVAPKTSARLSLSVRKTCGRLPSKTMLQRKCISLSICDSHCYFLYVFFEFEKKITNDILSGHVRTKSKMTGHYVWAMKIS